MTDTSALQADSLGTSDTSGMVRAPSRHHQSGLYSEPRRVRLGRQHLAVGQQHRTIRDGRSIGLQHLAFGQQYVASGKQHVAFEHVAAGTSTSP